MEGDQAQGNFASTMASSSQKIKATSDQARREFALAENRAKAALKQAQARTQTEIQGLATRRTERFAKEDEDDAKENERRKAKT